MQSELHKAAFSGDLDGVLRQLSTTHPSVKDHDGFTPLHEAAQSGNIDVLHALVEAGADLHAKDKHQNNPLHEAARSNHPDACLALLQQGADIEARGYEERTPLHYAAMYGSQDATRTLIELGADVSAGAQADMQDRLGRTATGITPLHLAAQCGINADTNADPNAYTDIARQLVQAGANVNATEKSHASGWTSLIPGVAQSWGSAPIHEATTGEMVHELARLGADLNAHKAFVVDQLTRGDTPKEFGTEHPLISAFKRDNAEVAIALLGCGSDPTIKNGLQQSFETLVNEDPLRVPAMEARLLQKATPLAGASWSPSSADADGLVPDHSPNSEPQMRLQGRRL